MNKDILKKVDAILESEGNSLGDISVSEKFEDFLLPSLQNSKSTLAELHKFEPKNNGSFLGRLKAKIISKIRNITINTVERESMRQQKFNDVVFQAIELLVEENKELRQKLDK